MSLRVATYLSLECSICIGIALASRLIPNLIVKISCPGLLRECKVLAEYGPQKRGGGKRGEKRKRKEEKEIGYSLYFFFWPCRTFPLS